jgi:phosphoribosyl-ATP pyrophosphohydrolase
MAGYHSVDIPRGIIGEPSKILEETLEFVDACKQDAHIMALVELSDLYGSIQQYLLKHHPSVTMQDLEKMASLTAKAFNDGTRCSRN